MRQTAAESIQVRRARPADAGDFVRMMGEPDVFANLMQMPLPSEEAWRSRLEEDLRPGSSTLSLVAELDGRVVGSAGLHPAQPLRRRHVATLGISVEPAAQRRGVGGRLMQTMCDYADGWAQILRIELTVFADNERAAALYRRFGFRVEGRHRGYALRNGAFEDVLSMARLHPRPPGVAWPDD